MEKVVAHQDNRQAQKKKKAPKPPVIGECPRCGTEFPSRYSRKTHRCAGKRED